MDGLNKIYLDINFMNKYQVINEAKKVLKVEIESAKTLNKIFDNKDCWNNISCLFENHIFSKNW